MKAAELTALLEPVCRKFFGEPRRISPTELRFGSRGQLKVDLRHGRWFDFDTNKGGNVLDIIKQEEGYASDDECLAWLETEKLWTNGRAGEARGGTPRDDAEAERRAREEAQRVFDGIEDKPNDGAPAYTHVWRSKEGDLPCTPTGQEHRDEKDGRVYAQVINSDGGLSIVPKDELFAKEQSKSDEKPAEPKPTDGQGTGFDAADAARMQGLRPTLRVIPAADLAETLAAWLKNNPDGPFDAERLERFEKLAREQPKDFARLCRRYPALATAVPLDAAGVRAALENASKDEVVALFVDLAVTANLNPVEIDTLRRLVAKKAGVGLQPLKDMLKEEQAKQAAQRRQAARAKRLAERSDPRPPIDVPAFDAPWLPQTDKINAVLGKSPAAVPPARDIDGISTRLRRLSVPKMHAFDQTQSNPPGDDDHD